MAILSTYLGGTDTTDGTVLNAADLIDSLEAAYPKIQQVYSGSAINSSQSGSAGTNTNTYEMTEIPASDLTNKTYLKVIISGVGSAGGGSINTGSGSATVKAEIKEMGGTYSDIESSKTVFSFYGQNNGGSSGCSYVFLRELTSGEKSNGCQVRISSSSTAGGTSVGSASYTHQKTVIELI